MPGLLLHLLAAAIAPQDGGLEAFDRLSGRCREPNGGYVVTSDARF